MAKSEIKVKAPPANKRATALFDKLSPRNRVFIGAYVDCGMVAAKASRITGFSCGHAAKIMIREDVKAYLTELTREPPAAKNRLTRCDQIKKLSKIVEDIAAKDSDKIKAIEVQNKMLGFNAPEVIEQTVHKGGDVEVDEVTKVRMMKQYLKRAQAESEDDEAEEA